MCEGYANKSTWQKPIHGKSQPIALQSKDSYGDTGGLMPRWVVLPEMTSIVY